MGRSSGLDHQLGALRARFDGVAAGGALVVVVHGEPGTGRTRATGTLSSLASRAGLRVAQVRAAPYDGDLPCALLRAIGDELDAKLVPIGRIDPESIAEAAARTVEAAAARENLPGSCILLDDAHWTDEASLRVLLDATRRLQGRSVALVITTGPCPASSPAPALIDEMRASPDAVLVRLGPLPSSEATAFIDARLGGPAPCPVHEALLRRTGRNPFLLAALLDHVTGVAGAPLEEATIHGVVPDRVRAVVSARLRRLGPHAVALARAVHVLGDNASLSRAAALAGLDRRTAEDAGDALARIGTMRPGPVLAFVQSLVCDAVGVDIEPYVLDRLQREAAALLVAERHAPTTVVRHLLRTTPAAQPWVVDQLRAAAETSAHSGDCATAATLLQRALQEPPTEADRPCVLAELAFAESRAGLADAAQTLEDALSVVTSRDTRLMLLRERTRLMWLTGRLPEAVVASETALGECAPGTELHDQLLAELLAVASMHDLAPIYARPKLVELVKRAGAGWVPESAALAATLAAVLPFVLGDNRLVGPLVDHALREDLWRVDAPPFGLRPDFVIGSLWLSGSLERGTRIVHEGQATVSQDNLLRHGLLHYWLGEIRYAAGDLPGAIEAASHALEPRWGPFLSWFGFSSATLANAFMDLEDRRRAEQVLVGAEGLDPHQLTGIAVDLARARLLLVSERPAEALELTDLVAGRLEVLGHDNGAQIAWRPTAAAAAMGVGDRARAGALLEEEIAFAERTHASGRAGRAHRQLAGLVGPAARLDMLRRSVEVLEPSEYRLELARSLVALGVQLHDHGEVPAARAALTEAREIAEGLGAVPLANQALTGLHATGARPRRTARSGVDSLTSTERRIVELAATGKTNRVIADALDIAPRTVEWHLSHAFDKLGVRSRRDLSAALDRRAVTGQGA